MFDFETGCPVAGCTNNKTLLRWTHHNCGAYEKLDSEGVVTCLKGDKLGEFFLLKYDCGGHSNGLRYGSYSAFLAALSICSNFGADFAVKLTDKLLKAYKEGRLPKDE